MKYLGFSMQKNGEKPEKNKDALTIHKKSINEDVFAVSDGASLGSFSGEWSEILVNGVDSFQGGHYIMQWLKPLQKKWHDSINWNSHRMHDLLIRDKAEQGGFATLLVFSVAYQDWFAYAIGDSCLFQIRNKEIIKAFPVDSTNDFSTSPDLICSNPDNNPDFIEDGVWQITQGKVQNKDIFILATDALAEWILRNDESIENLLKIKNKRGFKRLINKLRKKRQIKNDDTTIIIIRTC